MKVNTIDGEDDMKETGTEWNRVDGVGGVGWIQWWCKPDVWTSVTPSALTHHGTHLCLNSGR